MSPGAGGCGKGNESLSAWSVMTFWRSLVAATAHPRQGCCRSTAAVAQGPGGATHAPRPGRAPRRAPARAGNSAGDVWRQPEFARRQRAEPVGGDAPFGQRDAKGLARLLHAFVG